MTTKLNIKDRKNTTQKALEELDSLIESFEGKFENDVNTVASANFFAKIEVDNDRYFSDIYYQAWFNTRAYWRIQNGTLSLVSVDNPDYGDRERVYHIDRYQQINFLDCIEGLEIAIEKYNDLCAKKDEQIEKFLAFCAELKK